MIIYQLIGYLSLSVILIGLLFKGLKNRQYWSRWGERFGCLPDNLKGKKIDLWVHSVSVGEVRAAKPLIDRWQKEHPEHVILLTSTTPTGSDMANLLFGDRVLHCYFPYDIAFFMRRFISQITPKFTIIMETEIWPNLIVSLHDIKSKIIYVNVRMSAKSYRGYRRFKSLLHPVLEKIDRFAVQGELDKTHLMGLGVASEKIEKTGSIKFDFNIPTSLKESAAVLNHQLGQDKLIWVAGSTREGEEGRILSVYARLKKSFPNALLILVPRHPERFDAVYRKTVRRGLNCVRRSSGTTNISDDIDVYLGDTMGELLLMYACADVAFVGGSLEPLGGQNILEPCALGVPVLFGPHMYNFPDIAKWTEQIGAGVQVKDSNELAMYLERLFESAELRDEMGKKGIELIQAHSGALDKTYDFICQYID